ncbi:acetolactate decarboxylase [Candidatus Coxiella mudrowiae]|uniref:acetolactate decarboxylase n=1 Tax=Candidatus Coxiella mudrowiae TaxID=2054173 RepID=UPI0012FE968D
MVYDLIKSDSLHLHFVDEDISIGVHFLDINLSSEKIYFQKIISINIIFPQMEFYKNVD